jgi:type III restriction enzyme
MTVSIKFDGGQDYQLEAIDSVISLFQGWNSFEAERLPEGFERDTIFVETLFSNQFGVSDERLLENIKLVQSRQRFDYEAKQVPIVPAESRWPDGSTTSPRNFSVEMETGTGKTYVYLRTAIELYLKYGISKFVIVVPTVAIREGVLASLDLMKEHFRSLYAGVQYDSYVYESKYLGRLRQFATTKHLQILVMNVQAFSRDTTIIRRDAENLNGNRPLDYIAGVHPVVILDEPQKLGSKRQVEAIATLNPLFQLRYSATHTDPQCLVYRLGPVDAYAQRLVKRIEVLSMVAEEDHNIAYVELKKVTVNSGTSPTASILINKDGRRVNFTVKALDSLAEITGMHVYKGWDVEQISATTEFEPGFISFTNGRKIHVNTNNDVDRDWWQRAQIAAAIEKHFETELRLQRAVLAREIQPMKPLTLFFIDKVSNYDPEDGKFKVWFDELYDEIAGSVRKFRNLEIPSAKESRKGYFSVTKGRATDTNGDSKEDSEAYNLIMKEKERLLSPEEPVRFIFSHSMLSEGWDNPNVFTICNLQESQSVVKRRQQIGRGLRLPVMANGERCRLDHLNRLTVIASETFEKYAAALQAEMNEEKIGSMGSGIVNAREAKTLKLKPEVVESSAFKELWSRIAKRTKYDLEFSSDDLVSEGALRLKLLGTAEPIRQPRVAQKRVEVVMSESEGIRGGSASAERYLDIPRAVKVNDFLAELQDQLPISRSAVARIIVESGRLEEVKINPAQFVSQVNRVVRQCLATTLVRKNGIRYEPLVGDSSEWSAKFDDVESFAANVVEVQKSIYGSVVVDSDVERRYALGLDAHPEVELFLKLPHWFKIQTPIGNYNPDWAIVRNSKSGERSVYLVRETKGSTDISSLRFESEGWKIQFGSKHFEAIGVDYNVTSDISQLDFDIPLQMNFDDQGGNEEGEEANL